MADIKIALAGNPNSGKTTMFNDLTGSNQYVGNWPGVTVEKKEGKLKGENGVIIQDLPGIYSLSPYTLEEVVARNYLVNEKPDAIINIVDGTNIERNLYLTTQLIELGLPVVVAVNMMDLVRKNGDQINVQKLGQELGCEIVETSALKGEGSLTAAKKAMELAKSRQSGNLPAVFNGSVEHAIAHIEESIEDKVDPRFVRWYAVKVFERDEKVLADLNLDKDIRDHIESHIVDCEKELDDDAESIITNQRYTYIAKVVSKSVKKKAAKNAMTVSDKIDRIVTNRWLGLPIFACVILIVYAVAMGGWKISIGTALTDWANDGLFGDGWFLPFVSRVDDYDEAAGAFEEAEAIIEAYENGETVAYMYDDEAAEDIELEVNAETYAEALEVEEPDPADYGVYVPSIPALLDKLLTNADGDPVIPEWLYGLIMDGIVAGIGAVLGFVPQMLVLFLFLAILEDIGYMARVAFVMDRIFRQFGLSGKSFIPMLVATGCGIPGLMASRTIENDRDRKLTLMTTTFMPCGAKMPIIGLFAGALFGHSAWVAASAYFIGMASIVISGIMLKKFKAFAGDPAPFVMELPAYHVPSAKNVLRATWERGWSFIKRAGSVIVISSIIIWFLSGFGFTSEGFGMVEDMDASILAVIGNAMAWLFVPLGFGTWQATVATITGLVAKEEVVGTMGVLYGNPLLQNVGDLYTGISGYSFMCFNLLCAPCFAAIGAIKREMNNAKWTWGAIGYMCAWAYAVALIAYNLVGLFFGVGFSVWTVLAAVVLAAIVYLTVRKNPYDQDHLAVKVK
ncbi:MAG: ferrous iron transporter B [Oscillospiraceae bacterium]|nr:ferrous iron transporter B [Oscillospiraceae bacterium]